MLWYLITVVVLVQVGLCYGVCTGLGTGKKDMKVKDQVLNALEKKCCRHLLQQQKQMESESMQKQIKFIESRFKLAQSTLLVFSPYFVLITCTRFLQAARYFISHTFGVRLTPSCWHFGISHISYHSYFHIDCSC